MIGEEGALIQAGTNKETKEMERTWAVVFSSIFQVFLLYFTLCIS